MVFVFWYNQFSHNIRDFCIFARFCRFLLSFLCITIMGGPRVIGKKSMIFNVFNEQLRVQLGGTSFSCNFFRSNFVVQIFPFCLYLSFLAIL